MWYRRNTLIQSEPEKNVMEKEIFQLEIQGSRQIWMMDFKTSMPVKAYISDIQILK